jgi:hypothetical protein
VCLCVVCLQLRDARYFHKFGEQQVHREIKHYEATLESLAASSNNNTPLQPQAYSTAQATAQLLASQGNSTATFILSTAVQSFVACSAQHA